MRKSTVKKYFNENSRFWISHSYDRLPYTYPTALDRLEKTLRIVSAFFPKGQKKVVDLGCGGGNVSVELARKGHYVTSVDISETMIANAQNHAKKHLSKKKYSNICFIKQNILETNLPAGTYDIVVSLGVIGYLPNDDGFFKEAHRLLKPKGILIFSCRNRLFNMVSFSTNTINEIQSGSAQELVTEIIELSKEKIPQPLARQFLKQLSNASKKLYAKRLPKTLSSKPQGNEKLTFSVVPRQHKPSEITKTATSFGFQKEFFLGVHPHPLVPNANALFPPYVFNTLAESMIPLSACPISLVWSSVFMGVFRKGKK